MHFCQRELLDVRIAMEAHDRRAGHVGERLADALGPRAIDEPEIGKRVSAQSVDQLGRRAGQNHRMRQEPALR